MAKIQFEETLPEKGNIISQKDAILLRKYCKSKDKNIKSVISMEKDRDTDEFLEFWIIGEWVLLRLHHSPTTGHRFKVCAVPPEAGKRVKWRNTKVKQDV